MSEVSWKSIKCRYGADTNSIVNPLILTSDIDLESR